MLFLLADSPQKLKLEKIHGTLIILFYVSPSSPQLQTLFLLKHTHKKATTLQQMTGGNTPNLLLKRLLRFSSTTQENIAISRQNLLFLLKAQKKTTKKHSSASNWWEYTKFCFKETAKTFSKISTTQENFTISRKNLPFLKMNKNQPLFSKWLVGKQNLVLKRMLELFLKNPPLKKILTFHNWKKAAKIIEKIPHKQTSNQKLNQWLKTYKMNFIYYKTNKQKVLNFVLTLDRSWRAKNALKLLSKYLKHRICEIKQYLNHILIIINQNILAILTIFFNFQKRLWKTLHQANFHSCY